MQEPLIYKHSLYIKGSSGFFIRRVQDLNLRAGMNRVGGFRVRCITTLPTLHNVYFLLFSEKVKKKSAIHPKKWLQIRYY